MKKLLVSAMVGVALLGLTGCTAPNSKDPIEQARVVLNGKYSYGQIKEITDGVATAYGLPVNDDSRSRIWSAVLAVTDKTTVKPMDVITCARTPLTKGQTFPSAVGLCFTTLK